jgi:hypothetical protein
MKNMINSEYVRLLPALLVALLWSLPIAEAQVPERMHYQGILTLANGDPVECANPLTCDQPLDMTFRIHPDAFNDTVLWDETQAGISVAAGLFNVILGAVEPIPASVFSGAPFLSIEINGNGELEPRTEIVSAAFALRSTEAVNALQFGGLPATDYVLVSDVGQLQGPPGPPGPAGSPGEGALVHAASSTPYDLTDSWTTTDITVTLQPTGPLSKILVIASVQGYGFGGNSNSVGLLRLARNGSPLPGTTVSQHTGFSGSNDHANTMTLLTVDQPSGTGPFTYAVQARSAEGIFQLNLVTGQETTSNIVAQEF